MTIEVKLEFFVEDRNQPISKVRTAIKEAIKHYMERIEEDAERRLVLAQPEVLGKIIFP